MFGLVSMQMSLGLKLSNGLPLSMKGLYNGFSINIAGGGFEVMRVGLLGGVAKESVIFVESSETSA